MHMRAKNTLGLGRPRLANAEVGTLSPKLVLYCGFVLQVRYARSHQYVQAGSGPEDNRQLFFARAPSSTTEEQITQLFAQFGEVSRATIWVIWAIWVGVMPWQGVFEGSHVRWREGAA
jgi:hypothetical protein